MRIFKKSDILDMDALDEELAPFFVPSGSDPASRGQQQESGRKAFLDLLRNALATGRQRLHQNHLDGVWKS